MKNESVPTAGPDSVGVKSGFPSVAGRSVRGSVVHGPRDVRCVGLLVEFTLRRPFGREGKGVSFPFQECGRTFRGTLEPTSKGEIGVECKQGCRVRRGR